MSGLEGYEDSAQIAVNWNEGALSKGLQEISFGGLRGGLERYKKI